MGSARVGSNPAGDVANFFFLLSAAQAPLNFFKKKSELLFNFQKFLRIFLKNFSDFLYKKFQLHF